MAAECRQKFHAEVASLDLCLCAEADDVALFPGIFTFLVEDDIECDKLGHTRDGQVANNAAGIFVCPFEFLADESDVRNLGGVKPVSALNCRRRALFVEMLATFTFTSRELASRLAASNSNVPPNSFATPITREKPR
ncbi:hypothetical protein ABIA22_005151 [Sinorhizobium fredii]